MTLSTRYPSDGAMLFLLAVYAGETVRPVDGELRLSLPKSINGVVVPPTAFDDLEARGWIALTDDDARPVTTTEQGDYWLKRWMRSRLGPGRVKVTGVKLREAKPTTIPTAS